MCIRDRLLCVALTCSLAACGQTGDSSGSGPVNTGNFSAHDGLPTGEVKLLVHLQGIGPTINEEPTEESPDVFNSTRYITQAYEGLYPNVTIEFFRNFKSTDAPTQIEEQSILVAGGTCPDLFFAWGNALQGTGWLQTITDYKMCIRDRVTCNAKILVSAHQSCPAGFDGRLRRQ